MLSLERKGSKGQPKPSKYRLLGQMAELLKEGVCDRTEQRQYGLLVRE